LFSGWLSEQYVFRGQNIAGNAVVRRPPRLRRELGNLLPKLRHLLAKQTVKYTSSDSVSTQLASRHVSSTTTDVDEMEVRGVK
jgi:hypothetical protein